MTARHLPQTLEAVRLVIIEGWRPCDAARHQLVSRANLQAQLRTFRQKGGKNKLRKLLNSA